MALHPCLGGDTTNSFNVTAAAIQPMQQHSNSAFTAQARALRAKRKKPIEVFVSAGSFSEPYYTFKDKKGRTIKDFELDPSKKYRFRREDNASTHPFYISDQGFTQPATSRIKFKGDGDFNSGIIGSERFTLSIKKKHQEDFSASGRLLFFCTSHPSMLDEFIIDAGRRRSQQRTSEETFEASKQSIAADRIEHQQPTIQSDAFPLISAEPWGTEAATWDSAVAIFNIRP